jgi:AcrR family transcriptional regulator
VRRIPAPRKDHYHHGDLRNALLETALRLVAERGPEGFSLREAARAVGVSPGAAYRHFADKAALMGALAVDGHVRMAAAMEAALARVRSARGSAAHAVASAFAIGEAYVEFAVAHPAHFRVMFGPCEPQEEDLACLGQQGRGTYQILIDVLDQLVAAGVVSAEARAGAELPMWSFVHGLASLLVDGSISLVAEERRHALRGGLRVLLAGLGCSAADLPSRPPAIDADPRPPGTRPAPG